MTELAGAGYLSLTSAKVWPAWEFAEDPEVEHLPAAPFALKQRLSEDPQEPNRPHALRGSDSSTPDRRRAPKRAARSRRCRHTARPGAHHLRPGGPAAHRRKRGTVARAVSRGRKPHRLANPRARANGRFETQTSGPVSTLEAHPRRPISGALRPQARPQRTDQSRGRSPPPSHCAERSDGNLRANGLRERSRAFPRENAARPGALSIFTKLPIKSGNPALVVA